METSQPWAADWPSWKIPNGARELIWATIVRRGLSSVRVRTRIKSPRKWRRVGKSRPLKAFLRVTFALLSGGLSGQTRGGRRLGTLTHCRAIFIEEAQAAFPHGFVTWANRPLSNNGQSMPARRFPPPGPENRPNVIELCAKP